MGSGELCFTCATKMFPFFPQALLCPLKYRRAHPWGDSNGIRKRRRFEFPWKERRGDNILDASMGLIAPPGQEGWREAPGWLFNRKVNSLVQLGYS